MKDNPNYNIQIVEGTLTILPRKVTIKANDARKTVGTSDPKFTADVTGLAYDDKIDYTLSREAGETVGTYAITPVVNKDYQNYKISRINGTFTITPENTDKPGGDINQGTKITSPGTGDTDAVVLWSSVLAISAVFGTAAAVKKRKKYK